MTSRLTPRLVPAVALLLACAGGDLVLPDEGVPGSIEVTAVVTVAACDDGGTSGGGSDSSSARSFIIFLSPL